MKKLILPIIVSAFLGHTEAVHSSASHPTLYETLAAGKSVAVVNVNDIGTDADSLQKYMDSLYLGSQYASQVIQFFVTDDEANPDSIKAINDAIADRKIFSVNEGENDGYLPLKEYYAGKRELPEGHAPYRAQDTAVTILPLADRLGVTATVIAGELAPHPTINAYFGQCGTTYGEPEQPYLDRIHPETGSAAVIKLMRQQVAEGKLIYLLNGGSFQLLSDIAEKAPDLVPYIDATVMAFKFSMPFIPVRGKPRASYNESFNLEARDAFLNFVSNPANPKFAALRITDSNTVHYGMINDGKELPLYQGGYGLRLMLAENLPGTDLKAITDPIIIRNTDGSYQYILNPSQSQERVNVINAPVITALNELTFESGADPHFLPVTNAVAQDITLNGGHAHPGTIAYLSKILTPAAFENMLKSETLHEVKTWFKTKFMDSLLAYDAFGRAPIKRELRNVRFNPDTLSLEIAPEGEAGFEAWVSLNKDGEHFYSYDAKDTTGKYAMQIKNVAEYKEHISTAFAIAQQIINDAAGK